MSFHTFVEFDAHAQQRGIIVPQQVYAATTAYNRLPTIRFVENGAPGANLGNAFNQQHGGLANKDLQPQMSEAAKKVTIHINWPGYPPWSMVMHVFDHSYEGRAVSLARITREIAKIINNLKKDMAGKQSAAQGWTLDYIPLEQIVLLELRHVSKGSWQPVFCLEKH